MAPPNPKSTARRRRPTLELPFDDGEVLNADDPRPQRVPQYPSEARRVAPRRQEEAIPTTVYEIGQDEELPPSYDPRDLSDPGYKPAFLYVEKGPGQGQLVQVKQGSLVIGRASVSDLRLQHPSVSRRHAQITRLGERFYLKDLGSQNATYVNKVRIETEIEIYPGDQIQIGTAVLKLRGPAERVPEAAKRQIDKAAAKSAQRRPVVHEPTEPKARPLPATGPNKVLLGVACAAIGFGLAAVALFVLLNLTQQRPQFEVLASPQQVQPTDVAAASPEAPAPAAAPASPDPVAERIAREMAQKRAEAEAEAEPVVTPEPVKVSAPAPARPAAEEVSAAKIARRERITPKRTTPVKPAPAPSTEEDDEDDWADEVAPKKGANNGEALKLYEAGDVAGAIAAARAAGDADLAKELSDFEAAYAAGQKAERAGDGAGAVRNYQQALAVDEKISGGWGKHAAAINKRLGNIYVLWGQQLLKDDDEDGAKKAFNLALKYDPTNRLAKKYLADGASETRPAAPAKTDKRAATQSAIEDAWED